MSLMFPNKKISWIFILSLSITLPSCFRSSTNLNHPIASTATVLPASIQSPTLTDDRATQKQELLSEASHKIDEYNALVEQEKISGEVNILHNSDTGQDAFFFTGESDKKIRTAYDNLEKQLSILNDKYLVLYKQDYVPTPFPSLDASKKLKLYYQLLQEDQSWVGEQLKAETALKIYDPDLGTYDSILNLEQTARLGLRSQALNELRLEAELPTEMVTQQKNLVEKLDGASVEESEVTSLPFYRTDLSFFQYRTPTNYYLLNVEGEIIEIIPIQMPLSEQLTPIAPLNTSQLEEKARAFITLVAPDTKLDMLTSITDSKIGSFFFRWEDRSKPLLDDGRSYPFIQVALNSDGELLNYYNTLPLSR